MQRILFTLSVLGLWTVQACAQTPSYQGADFQVKSAKVYYQADLEQLVWDIEVEGQAGATTPTPAGQLHGAPVLGYVFPTSLKPTDVGFGASEGILALALTSHPDFDDTPLWDENGDQKLDNDGVVWHPHWVVLVEDKRVAGGYAVKQFDPKDETVMLPPTNPGMPMYMDSPGFQVITQDHNIRVVVPAYRMNHQTEFLFDALACYMQVNGKGGDLPMLGVYEVYSVEGGALDLTLSAE